MPLEEPGWWYGEEPDSRRRLLAPFARLYGSLVERRFRRAQPYRSRFPVICVGNFTAGGTGKTPLAIYIARRLLAAGHKPVFLTRGYGGKERGPVWVEPSDNAAWRFGDEPLLLARVAPTLVARDRREGACFLEASGHAVSAIIMDDGLQNPALAKDLSLAVVDGRRGLGNGEVIPAGPLRAPLDFQLSLADAIVVREAQSDAAKAERDIHAILRHHFPGPVMVAHTEPSGDTAWLAGAPVVAFAGIVAPERFFALLEGLGANIVERVAFRDHHPYSRAEAERLIALAREESATLVTTEKDWVRLSGGEGLPPEFATETRTLAIELAIDARDEGRLASLIEAATSDTTYPRRTQRPPQL